MPYAEMSDKERAEAENFGLELYTVKQVAAILKISVRSVMTYVGNGRLRGQKIGGRWKFTREAIESFAKGE